MGSRRLLRRPQEQVAESSRHSDRRAADRPHAAGDLGRGPRSGTARLVSPLGVPGRSARDDGPDRLLQGDGGGRAQHRRPDRRRGRGDPGHLGTGARRSPERLPGARLRGGADRSRARFLRAQAGSRPACRRSRLGGDRDARLRRLLHPDARGEPRRLSLGRVRFPPYLDDADCCRLAGAATSKCPTCRPPVLASIGILDTGGNVFFAAASAKGLVSVVSILASLYPVVTVLLARAVLHERVHRSQELGIVLALAGIVLISAG